MRYDGILCPHCGEAFREEGEVVVCPRCGTPEHRACWAQTNVCVNEDRHDAGYVWQDDRAVHAQQAPDAPSAPQEKQQVPDRTPCPACGTLNDFGEPVCVRCGERLYWSREDGNAYDPQNDSPFGRKGYHYGYAQSNFQIDGIPATEVAAYVRQNADVYLTKFLYMDNRGKKTGFNWAAAFFPYLWLLSRKMYKAGLLIMAAFLACSVLTMFNRAEVESNRASINILRSFFAGDLSPEEALSALESLPEIKHNALYYVSLSLRLALSLFVALKGDALYRKQAVNDILAAREQAHDSDTYFALLAKKGGTSPALVLGGFFGFQFLVFGLSQLIALLFF